MCVYNIRYMYRLIRGRGAEKGWNVHDQLERMWVWEANLGCNRLDIELIDFLWILFDFRGRRSTGAPRKDSGKGGPETWMTHGIDNWIVAGASFGKHGAPNAGERRDVWPVREEGRPANGEIWGPRHPPQGHIYECHLGNTYFLLLFRDLLVGS